MRETELIAVVNLANILMKIKERDRFGIDNKNKVFLFIYQMFYLLL